MEKDLWVFLLGSGGALSLHIAAPEIVSVPAEGGNPVSVTSEGLSEVSGLRFWYGISACDRVVAVPPMRAGWEKLL